MVNTSFSCLYLGGANRGKVLGVREKDDPVVTDKLMELDGSLRGIGFKIRRSASQPQLLLLNDAGHICFLAGGDEEILTYDPRVVR
jgi:hypothetical protein